MHCAPLVHDINCPDNININYQLRSRVIFNSLLIDSGQVGSSSLFSDFQLVSSELWSPKSLATCLIHFSCCWVLLSWALSSGIEKPYQYDGGNDKEEAWHGQREGHAASSGWPAAWRFRSGPFRPPDPQHRPQRHRHFPHRFWRLLLGHVSGGPGQ